MLHLFGLPETPWVVFLTLSLGGILSFLAMAGLSYLFFFIWRKKRFHPDYKADWNENFSAIRWSIFSVLGNAVLMMPFHVLIAQGHSKMYYNVSDYGWEWMLLSAVGILVITETCVYWIHRALHSNLLYGALHAPHHKFRVPTPWVGVAFNPLDSFAQALPHHLCVFLFPVHIGLYTVFVSFISLWAVMIHDRLSFMPWAGVNYTGHHTLHHWYYNCNYGQFFTLWDRLMGTYVNPESVRNEVPESVSPPHQTLAFFRGRLPFLFERPATMGLLTRSSVRPASALLPSGTALTQDTAQPVRSSSAPAVTVNTMQSMGATQSSDGTSAVGSGRSAYSSQVQAKTSYGQLRGTP